MKYIRYAFNGEEELYDVATDPFETTNLAADPSFRGGQARLSQRLDQLLAPRPVDTTIVTGPSGPLHTRDVRFTYFSPSRAATYACRFTHSRRRSRRTHPAPTRTARRC